mmetsp:Transcript_14360/g.28876  ORF Transcript_14360/g.28876 Transcript_14360/m.28876 type:complete len:173 (-) Transcript_14360:2557-3075(-)
MNGDPHSFGRGREACGAVAEKESESKRGCLFCCLWFQPLTPVDARSDTAAPVFQFCSPFEPPWQALSCCWTGKLAVSEEKRETARMRSRSMENPRPRSCLCTNCSFCIHNQSINRRTILQSLFVALQTMARQDGGFGNTEFIRLMGKGSKEEQIERIPKKQKKGSDSERATE